MKKLLVQLMDCGSSGDLFGKEDILAELTIAMAERALMPEVKRSREPDELLNTVEVYYEIGALRPKRASFPAFLGNGQNFRNICFCNVVVAVFPRPI